MFLLSSDNQQRLINKPGWVGDISIFVPFTGMEHLLTASLALVPLISYFSSKEFLINSEKEIMEADSGPFSHAPSALSISLSVFSLGIVYLLHSIVTPSPPLPATRPLATPCKMLLLLPILSLITNELQRY